VDFLAPQDGNKYASHKYRLVVRFSNRYVYCQIIYSEIEGDKVLCSATSRELKRYGLSCGLKNYAAAYCTGLLLSRRLLQHLGLDEIYTGVEEATGEIVKTKGENGRRYFVEELDDEKKPFRAYLDVGIVNTTTGNRVFGALKGAVDGGLDVPHNPKRFPGYDKDRKKYVADDHRDRIFGAHVAEYMETVQEEDEEAQTEKFKDLFPSYENQGCTTAEELEEMYTKVHESIREDPSATKSEFVVEDKDAYKKQPKLTYDERKANLETKKAAMESGEYGQDEEGEYEEGEYEEGEYEEGEYEEGEYEEGEYEEGEYEEGEEEGEEEGGEEGGEEEGGEGGDY